MALTLEDFTAHLNATGIPADDAETALRQRMLDAASAHIGRQLGFAIDDATQFPDGTPADLDQAVLMLAAHWYQNRETVMAADSRAVALVLPYAVAEIVNEYRNFTFGIADA